MALDEQLRSAIRNEIQSVLAEKRSTKVVAKYINPIYDAIHDARIALAAEDIDIERDLEKVEGELDRIARKYN